MFPWARGAAVAALVANVALYVGVVALTPSPGTARAHPDAFGPNTGWALLFVPLTAALFLLAVVLTMEYRVRSRAADEAGRRPRLRLLLALLAPVLAHHLLLAVIVARW